MDGSHRPEVSFRVETERTGEPGPHGVRRAPSPLPPPRRLNEWVRLGLGGESGVGAVRDAPGFSQAEAPGERGLPRP